MKIALIAPEYPPDSIGGGGVVMTALANQYAESNDVQVFTAADSLRSWFDGPVSDSTDGFIVHRYPLVPIGIGVSYLRSAMPPNPRAGLALWRDLRRWHPDIAHLHGYGHAFIDVAALALSRLRVPYLFTIHGIPTRPSHRGLVIRKAFGAYQAFGVAMTIRRAAGLTAVSASAAGYLATKYPVHVIPNGTHPALTCDETGSDLIAELGLDPKASVLAGVGRISVEKGFDVLIRALNLIGVDLVECVIAGADGGAEHELRRLSRDLRPGVSLRLTGRLEPKSLACLYARADLVVVPSRAESFGLVALEALSHGKRLIASRVGGLEEILDEQVAQLVQPDDPAGLAREITISLRKGPLTSDERRRAQSRAADYSWPVVANRYETLMRAILTSGRASEVVSPQGS